MFKNIHRCGYEVNSENKINLDDYLAGNIFRKLKSSCLPCHIIVGGKKDLVSFVGYLITATSVPRWSHRQMIFYFCNWNVSYTCESEFVIYEKCIL